MDAQSLEQKGKAGMEAAATAATTPIRVRDDCQVGGLITSYPFFSLRISLLIFS
jgi:hypothetical protein